MAGKLEEEKYVAMKRALEDAMTEWVCCRKVAIHASGYIMLAIKAAYEGAVTYANQ